MTPTEMIAVIQAHAEGKEIECRSDGMNAEWWIPADHPSWNFETFEYRVKPAPKDNIVREYVVHLDHSVETCTCAYAKKFGSNLKLVFDGNTNELLSAEVLK